MAKMTDPVLIQEILPRPSDPIFGPQLNLVWATDAPGMPGTIRSGAPEHAVAFHRANMYASVGQGGKAVAIYDGLLARLSTATERPFREQVAKTLVNKAAMLSRLGQVRNAIEVYDDLIARFGTATEASLREQVAIALANKAVNLSDLGCNHDALKVCDELIASFGTATEASLREQVVKALANKALWLNWLGRGPDATDAILDLMDRTPAEVSLHKRVWKGVVSFWFDESVIYHMSIDAAAGFHTRELNNKLLASRTETPARSRPLYRDQSSPSQKLSPPDFIRQHYAAEIASDELHMGLIRRADPALYSALNNWLRHHVLPSDLHIPKVSERRTEQIASQGIPRSTAKFLTWLRTNCPEAREAIDLHYVARKRPKSEQLN